MDIQISLNENIGDEEVLKLYCANGWSSTKKPIQLLAALRNSATLVTARIDGKLVGLANAITDGHLVVYFPHMLVAPSMQKRGIGRKIMGTLLEKYGNFHQLMLTADGNAVEFYKRLGFIQAGKTVPLWIYQGNDH